jgi:hypothetical protein
MKVTSCSICHKSNIPINETIRVENSTYCEDCFNTTFKTKADLQGKQAIRNMDPTICSSCKKDFGPLVLSTVAEFPVCEECIKKINKKIFPLWVKIFLTAIAGIIVFSIVWNFRFYGSYMELKKSNKFLDNGDYKRASELMLSASNKVPEVKDLGILAEFYSGLSLLQQDKPSEALVQFNKCKSYLSNDYHVDFFINQAIMSEAYNSKNYDRFLASALDNLNYDSTAALSFASVASAYACVYAVSNNESKKKLSFFYLNKAKSLNDTSPDMKTYYNSIEYRIATKNIIDPKQFDSLYPNGWNNNK